MIHWFALLQTVYLLGVAVAGGATASEITIVTVATVATALAMIGPGYSDFREALAHPNEPDAA